MSLIHTKTPFHSLRYYQHKANERRELETVNQLKKDRKRAEIHKLEAKRNKGKSKRIIYKSRKLLNLFYGEDIQYFQFTKRLQKAYSGLIVTSILAKRVIRELVSRELIELIAIERYRGESYNLEYYALTKKGLELVFPIKYPPIFFNYLQNWDRAEMLMKKVFEGT